MGKRANFKEAKGKRPAGSYAAFPHVVLRSQSFARLSAIAVKLLCELLAQYRGTNNGDLSIAWKLMSPRSWKSEDTLNRAKDELLAAQFIEVTRRGARPNKAALYGITFYALDENPKLEITVQGFHRGAWNKDSLPIINIRMAKELVRVTPEKNALLTPIVGVVKAA